MVLKARNDYQTNQADKDNQKYKPQNDNPQEDNPKRHNLVSAHEANKMMRSL